ncbi:phosphoribosylformylglycinamidine cyclo-ligase [Spirulina sp. 06S082]|uniref:phosphoribosylformylglycinamidine cyclo-ligase n=1 Tax=Spirulina sp. 06S082 TaxID=3110248 RepID=UPI002B21E1D8|nr:phosphoribosylformylglycinamidine cyclo-ligase [Spirulina sp. 06S082]MEA5468883.1 phosphoribosylformylglycinamidine cyclo-ligase [Spirulina sp. 06S082]
MDYRAAGVDVEAGRAFVHRIGQDVKSTHRPEVLGALGGFAGCFQLPTGYEKPVLVSGTDGVGTKLKIANAINRHDTIGIDLVAMCVNDILTTGAEPLFFLDYVATGKLESEQLAEVVAGIASGCRESGCALLGGETAEMPGFYPVGEYDLAGFCVGIVEKDRLLDGSRVEIGDRAIALASSGLHSNGFSLVRKVMEIQGLSWHDRPEILGGQSLGEIFLTPTRIYVKPILEALRSSLDIHGMAHITGGGLPENLPRCFNADRSVRIDRATWKVPPVFQWLADRGEVSQNAMFETFNMGLGYIIIVPPQQAEDAVKWFGDRGFEGYAIGEVIAGNGTLIYE